MLESKYGKLLDKYMDDKHVNYRTKQEHEQAERSKYENLLDHTKPNNKIYETYLMLIIRVKGCGNRGEMNMNRLISQTGTHWAWKGRFLYKSR